MKYFAPLPDSVSDPAIAKLRTDLLKITSDLGSAIESNAQSTEVAVRPIAGLLQTTKNQNQAIIELQQQSAKTTTNLVPDPRWITPNAGNDQSLWYRRTITEIPTEIYLEFAHSTDLLTIGIHILTDFTTGFSPSGFWGGQAKFTDFTLPNGKVVKTVIAIDGLQITLCVLEGTKPARMRNVRINGTAQDLMPLPDRLKLVDTQRESVEKQSVTNAGAIATNATAISTNTALVNRLTKRTITVANAGVAVPVSDRIQCRIAPSGNQSLQFSAVSSAVTWEGWSQHTIENGITPATIASHSMSTTWEYAMSNLTFTRQCDGQTVYLVDTTNGRKFKVMVTIGSSFNNSQFVVEEFS